jgi:hypothetical protein
MRLSVLSSLALAGLASHFSVGAWASVNADVLMYRHFAHEAQDRQILAEGERSRARGRLRMAEFNHDQIGKLVGSKAATAFEYSNTILDMARARQQLARATAELSNAQSVEKAWRLRAKAADDGGDYNLEIAQLMVDARTEVQQAAQTCLDNVRPIEQELTFQHERSKILYQKSAISLHELVTMETVVNEVGTLVPVAERELIAATASLAEARADLAALVAAKKKR